MTPEPPDDLRALLDLAREYLRTREDLRRAVSAVGRTLAALAEWSTPSADVAQPTEQAAPPAPTAPPVVAEPSPPEPRPGTVPEPPVPVAALPQLTFAPPPVAPAPTGFGPGEVTPQPLPVLAERCRLKAEACRVAARHAAGAADRGTVADLVQRARSLPDCHLWMFDESAPPEPALVWEHLAGAFDAAAEAAEMLRVWSELPDATRNRAASEVLHLAAEAQAVLFAAVAAARRPKPDTDQVHLFVTIREEGARLRVFIARYLRREDRADPASGADVARRVRELAAPFRRTAEAARNRQKTLSNLRYKATRLRSDPAGNAGEWPRVVELLEELVTGGLPPSDAAVRDLVLPLHEQIPADLTLTPGAVRVFREIDRFLAARPPAEEPQPEGPPSQEVAEVRRLLAGRQVVLIGGQERPSGRDALAEAFGLSDLLWVTAGEHVSVSTFEAPIARPEVAVVLLAIRWSSHSYGDVQEYCDRFGKLLVRLPGGYHPNQVAHQILTQVGHRLRAAG